jgi:hypothetical protein
MDQPPRNDDEKVEIANRAEEIILHARRIARRIQERITKAMDRHDPPGPHVPPIPGVKQAAEAAQDASHSTPS